MKASATESAREETPVSGLDSHLDLAAAEQLIGLRLLLESALDYVRTPGSLREVVGPVLLDGALERAVFIAGNRTGDVKSEKDSMEKVFNTLIGYRKGNRPEQHIMPIRNLHKARNAAQHQGIRCHPDEVRSWSVAVQVMCHWLMEEFAQADLATVTLASAIEDLVFRQEMQDAEEALADGRTDEAIRASRCVMDEAFNVWQEQILGRSSISTRSKATREERREAESSNRQLRDLHRGHLVASLSPDSGESAWFVENWSSFTLDAEDAARYVGFVTRWVVAFEATPARRRLMRRQYLARESRRVRTGPGPASVLGAEVVEQSWSDDFAIRIRFFDVPDSDDYSVWLQGALDHLRDWLGDRARALGDEDGSLLLERLDDALISELPMRLGPALEAGEAAIRATHDAKAEEERAYSVKRTELEAPLADTLRSLPSSVKSLQIVPGWTPGSDVSLRFDFFSDFVGDQQLTKDLKDIDAGLHFIRSGSGFELWGNLTPKNVSRAVDVVVSRAVVHEREAESFRAERETMKVRLRSSLEEVGLSVLD